MTKQARQVFHSLLTKDNGWVVLHDKQVVSKHANQKASEKAAVEEARAHYDDGGFGQAVLHKLDGQIREERTYGKDPERTRG